MGLVALAGFSHATGLPLSRRQLTVGWIVNLIETETVCVRYRDLRIPRSGP